MGFHVCLVDEVDPVLVTKIVPQGMIRIVTRPYAIDVMLLHQLDIPDHEAVRHGSTLVGIKLVSIGSLEV